MKIKRFTPPPEVAYVTYAVLMEHDLESGAIRLDARYHTVYEATDHVLYVNQPVDGSRASLSNGMWLFQLSDGTKVVADQTRFRQYVRQCGQEWPDD